MIIKAIRWICGYVSFKLTGEFPERFVNNVARERINLWDLKKIDGSLYAKVLASDYKLLRSRSRKANSKIRIKKKYGWPFFAFKYKRRIGIIIGTIIFIGILKFLSLHIWNINVYGNEVITTAEITAVMKDLGVKPGILKSHIDSAILKQEVMSKINDISWMSININGSCVNVSIKEKIKSPELVEKGEPCNIVASSEGQIERFESYCGQPTVKEGDAVTKGQILISGIIQEEGKTNLVGAEGKVFAKTKHKIIEKVKMNQLYAVDSGKIVKKLRINTMGKEISLTPWRSIDDQYRIEESSNKLNLFGVELPVIINQELCYHQKCEEKILSQDEAAKYMDEIIKKREEELKDVKIISKDIENREDKEEFISEVTFTCIENIGEKQKISLNSE